MEKKKGQAMRIQNGCMMAALFAATIAVSGCAAAISRDLRAMAAPDLTFEQVKEAPESYKGKIVIWGGEIIKTTNVEVGTRVEILQKPLNFELMPKYGDETSGRFIAIYGNYLDSAVYRKGREITVAGEILGEMTSALDEIEYTYPLISAREVYLWSERLKAPGYYYPYPYPFYRHWWYGPHWVY